jgi:hypothetical protein
MVLFSAFPFHAICLSSDSTTTGGLAVFLSFFAFCLRACFSGVSVFLRKMGTGHRLWRHTDTDRSFVFMETLFAFRCLLSFFSLDSLVFFIEALSFFHQRVFCFCSPHFGWLLLFALSGS